MSCECYRFPDVEVDSRCTDRNAEAQYTLGNLYMRGAGVPLVFTEAERWYRLAAEQGSAEAMQALGDVYWFGRAAPQDRVQAHMWYNLAAARHETQDSRDRAVRSRQP